MNILTLYYICYVILAMYMLDSDQEPSYNLSKNLLLLPRKLKLMKDMVNDSTPLIIPSQNITHMSQKGCNKHLYTLAYFNIIMRKYKILKPREKELGQPIEVRPRKKDLEFIF